MGLSLDTPINFDVLLINTFITQLPVVFGELGCVSLAGVSLSSREKETYGFKTTRLPDPKDSLTSFENAMYNLISNIMFKNHVDSFQKELRNDVKEINSSDGVLVHGDKSNNIYVVPKKSYNKMVDDSVTKTYRKAAANTKNEIDLEGSEIAERLELADRMEVFAEKEPFYYSKRSQSQLRYQTNVQTYQSS